MKKNRYVFAPGIMNFPPFIKIFLQVAAASFLVLFLSMPKVSAQSKLDWAAQVGAKQFPPGSKIYTVAATTDTSTVITRLIQKAIDQCAAKGGGIVTFKPGTYVTGAIFVKEGVQLRID